MQISQTDLSRLAYLVIIVSGKSVPYMNISANVYYLYSTCLYDVIWPGRFITAPYIYRVARLGIVHVMFRTNSISNITIFYYGTVYI